MLDDFANVLAETSQLFDQVAADFIVRASLKFITGLVLEMQSKDEPVGVIFFLMVRSTDQRWQMQRVDRYAMYLRELSGVAEAYAMFIFPTELPYNIYVQTLPLLRDVVNFMNDITSFYKEECEGDTHNLVSLLAEARGEPKSKALCYVVEKCMEAHERTLLILLPHRKRKGCTRNCEGVLGVPSESREI